MNSYTLTLKVDLWLTIIITIVIGWNPLFCVNLVADTSAHAQIIITAQRFLAEVSYALNIRRCQSHDMKNTATTNHMPSARILFYFACLGSFIVLQTGNTVIVCVALIPSTYKFDGHSLQNNACRQAMETVCPALRITKAEKDRFGATTKPSFQAINSNAVVMWQNGGWMYTQEEGKTTENTPSISKSGDHPQGWTCQSLDTITSLETTDLHLSHWVMVQL